MPALPRPITIFVQLPALKPFCGMQVHPLSFTKLLLFPCLSSPNSPPRPSLRFLVPSTPITTSQLASALAVIDFFPHHTRTFEKKKEKERKNPKKN